MKVVSLDELAEALQGLKEAGKRVVLCHGVFDLLHPGHIKHFQAARREGDVLVVTVTPDRFVGKGPGRPVFNEGLRAESIAALACVDFVAINQWPSAVETIKRIRPDVYVKGSDYLDREADLTQRLSFEREAVEAVGGRIHFTDEVSFSSSELINSYFPVYPEETRGFLASFRERYSARDIIGRMRSLKDLSVLVVGEAIIDEYDYCAPQAKSPKENLIPTRYLGEEAFAGGALACANHVAGFCGKVTLVTCLGQGNSREDFVRGHLASNIDLVIFRTDAPIIVKRRFVDPAFLTKMFEICFIQEDRMGGLEDLADYIARHTPAHDMVIAADFGHGLFAPGVIDALRWARYLCVNAQTNSFNMGFNLITKYPRADYICLDEPEIRLAAHERTGSLQAVMSDIATKLNASKMAVTRGHRGSVTYDGGFHETPVFSREVVDRMGAGDAYLSITSPCVAAGFPMDMVGFIGNAVGSLAIRIIGNKEPVEPGALFRYMTALLK